MWRFVPVSASSLASLRLLRWTIFIPLLIYFSLFLVNYKKNPPPKSLSPEDRGPVERFASLPFEADTLSADTKAEKDTSAYKKNAVGPSVDRRDENSIREVMRAEDRETPQSILEEVFRRADTDGSELLDIQELAKWIYAKITEHISRAMRENIGLFTAIDNNPRNGEVTWEEYHAHFLRSHGFSDSYINSHDKRHKKLSRSLKEAIMRDRARWAEAARNDPDRLALDEFLAFTHPESSHRALLQMVEDLFEKFDRDGDEQLTEDEFSSLPADGVGLDLGEDGAAAQHLTGSEDRRKEFRHLIDKNKNGKADRTELLMYIDPRNPRHAIHEARHLIALSDTDQDGKLSIGEVLAKMDLILGSKMVDTERSFHDEFR